MKKDIPKHFTKKTAELPLKKNETFTMKLTAAQLKKLHSKAKKDEVTASELVRQWIDAA